MLAFVEVVAVSEKSEVVENEGDSFGGEDGVRVGDMNVEMRAGRIAGVSELCDHLARFYFLMDAHADAVLLQMREHEVFVRRDADDDVIAGDVLQRDGWRLAGRMIFEVVDDFRDFAAGHRMQRLAEAPIVFIAISIVVKRFAVLAD